ncbi:MAG: hypothetical protein WCH21_03135 [Bacteroidota bacterium]
MKTPKNNENLKQLFNKAKADEQNLDDFEKEAMAGFNMLESENEANNLKTSLDNRINSELFYKKENHNQKVYWLAAAGLALVIGLSALFILNDTNSISKNNLAITDTKTENGQNIGGELKEEPAVAAETIAPYEKATSKDISEKNRLETKGLLDNKNIKGGKEEGKDIFSKISQINSANQEQSGVVNLEREKSSKKEIVTKSGEGVNAIGKKNENLDDLAKSGSAKDKESDVYKFQTTSAAPVQSPKSVAEAEKTVNDEIAGSVFNQKNKSEDANLDGDFKKDTKQPDLAKNSGAKNPISRKESRAKEKAKKTKTTQNTLGAAGPSHKENKPGVPSSTSKTEETKAIPADDKGEEKDFINCFYPGGASAVIKDIKEKLLAENLNQKFDVTLYINEKKVVDKVKFINSYDLTKKQKEELTKIFKSLNKFDFFMVPTKKNTYPYKVLYRP